MKKKSILGVVDFLPSFSKKQQNKVDQLILVWL